MPTLISTWPTLLIIVLKLHPSWDWLVNTSRVSSPENATQEGFRFLLVEVHLGQPVMIALQDQAETTLHSGHVIRF